MVFHDAEALKRLRRAADKYELLLIFDEIFVGFGRTGTMFACEWRRRGQQRLHYERHRRGSLRSMRSISVGRSRDSRWTSSAIDIHQRCPNCVQC